jgi:hypothetical protein
MFSKAKPDYYSIMIFVFTQECPRTVTHLPALHSNLRGVKLV